MNKKHVTIQQTLHGYSNGHHLLASSILLSDEAKRKMDMLSDFSNTEISEEFNSYYTGYFLEKERLIVFAKTWYAYEMTRPGCVWTHSLLIRLEDLTFCAYNINYLLSLFSRPNKKEIPNSYAKPLEIIVAKTEYDHVDDKKLQYLIWIMLGQEPPNCVISKNSEEYIKELLLVWFTCYNELHRDFSFITGTSSIKSGNANVISLQFCSSNARNNMANLSNSISLMKNISEVQKFPPWVISTRDLLIHQKWEEFLKFKNLFSFQENSNLSLTMFIKLYSCFYVGNKSIDIYSSLELIDKGFENEKSTIGNNLLNLYFDGKFKDWGKYHSYSNLVIASLKFTWICLPQTTLEELIRKAFETDATNSKKIVHYLVNLENPEIQEKYLTFYATILSPSNLEAFTEMDYSVCNVLVAINPILAKSPAIWEQSVGFQQGIFDSLKICETTDLLGKDIIKVILNTSKFDFASDIYAIWKEKSILEFLECLLGIQHLNHHDTSKMVELCKQHSCMASQLLSERFSEFSSEQILILFKIIDPYYDTISINVLVCVFPLLKIKSLSEDQRNEVADLYLPFILRDNYHFSDEIVAFSVLNIHGRLSKLSYPEGKWRKLQRLLPEASYFNQWDKCKRLRKAMKKKGFNIKQLNSYNDNELDIHLL
jgi:hypothetical protein